MRLVIFSSLLGFFCLFSLADANCKMHDAEFLKKKSPKVSLPKKNEPSKVLVDWSNILKNGRCVDTFILWIWDKKHHESTAKNFTLTKGTYSRVVDLEPCIDYNFKVGLIENDLFRTERKNSSVISHKTEAVPTLLTTDPKNFKVKYFYDHVRDITDLSKVSIIFPKTILQHTSCVKHIEVTGVEVAAPLTPKRPSFSSRFMARRSYGSYGRSYGGSGSYGSSYGGSGSYSSSYGGSGSYSSSHGGSGSYGSSHGGSGSYGSSHGGSGSYGSHGGSGTYGGSGSYGSGGSGSYGSGGSGSYGSGGSGSYGSGGSGTYGSGGYGTSGDSGTYGQSYRGTGGIQRAGSIGGHGSYEGHLHSYGDHGRDSYFTTTSRPDYSRGKREADPGLFGKKIKNSSKKGTTTTTTVKPSINSNKLGYGKISPPFFADYIEILVPVKPCVSYNFSVKVVSPQGSIMGTIQNLALPQLYEMHDYHPPSLSRVFKITKGTPASKIALQPNIGIPDECLPAFFKAVDHHMINLEDEIFYHLDEESRARDIGNKMGLELIRERESQLKTHGCKCSSERIGFNTTTAKIQKKHKDVFGDFFFEGYHNGRPYFRRPSSFAKIHPMFTSTFQMLKKKKNSTSTSTRRTKRFIGNIDNTPRPPPRHGQAQTMEFNFQQEAMTKPAVRPGQVQTMEFNFREPVTKRPQFTYNENLRNAPPKDGKIYYIMWNTKEKAWWVAESLTAEKPIFKTQKNSSAKCPADPETGKKWTTPHTFSWKVDSAMKATC